MIISRKYRCHVCNRVKPSPATELVYSPFPSRRCKVCGSIVDRIHSKKNHPIRRKVEALVDPPENRVARASNKVKKSKTPPIYVVGAVIITLIILIMIFGK